MKILITTLIILTSLSLFANERGAERREMNNIKAPQHNESLRAVNATKQAQAKSKTKYYLPAMEKEVSRDLMITNDRNKRNKAYKADTRFSTGAMAKALSQEVKTKSSKQVESELWADAESKNDKLKDIKKNTIRHTFIWYKIQAVQGANSMLDKQEKLEELSNFVK